VTDEKSNSELDALVARSLVERGELIPTTVEEVLETRADYDGELPRALERYEPKPEPPEAQPVKAASRNGDALRVLSYIGVGAAMAAAIAAFFVSRGDQQIQGEHLGTTRAGPAGTMPVASQSPVVIRKGSCEASCCGGGECASAETAYTSCPTERTCIPCAGLDQADRLYRVRLGNVASASGQTAAALGQLDLCVSVGSTPGSPWVCEPAYLPAATRPRGRFLAKASSVDELVGGVSMELRPKGQNKVLAAWRSGIKVGVGSLCKGVSVNLQNEQHEQVGTLSMFLERTYYVELARRPDRAALDEVATAFAFDGRTPRFMTVSSDVRGGGHVLALGPFDKPEAEALLRELRGEPTALGAGFRIDNGDDYDAH